MPLHVVVVITEMEREGTKRGTIPFCFVLNLSVSVIREKKHPRIWSADRNKMLRRSHEVELGSECL